MKTRTRSLPNWLSIPLSLAAWPVIAIFTILCNGLGVIFLWPFSLFLDGGKKRLMHCVAHFWGQGLVAMNPLWRVRTEGLHHVVPGRHYVIVANHQSLLDILVVLCGLKTHFKFMAKKELFSIPFLGWHLAMAGYIPLDRGNRESGREAILRAKDWIGRGVSVLLFPEGTRSRDGRIHEFKPGAFKIARDTGVDILPVVIDGTGAAIPKNSWKLERRTDFILSVGAPVSIADVDTAGGLDQVRQSVHREMVERLERLRKKPPRIRKD